LLHDKRLPVLQGPLERWTASGAVGAESPESDLLACSACGGLDYRNIGDAVAAKGNFYNNALE
jgi:hypothetical protein